MGPSLGLILAVAAVLIPASGFFSLFEQALKAARKTGLLKEADDAERRASAKRRGTVGYLKETGRAERYRRVLDAVENPDGHLVITGFWAQVMRILAAVFTGLGVGHLTAETAGVLCTALAVGASVAVIVVAIIVLDYLAKSVARFAPERIAAALLTPVKAFALPLRPILFLARKFSKWIRGIIPPKADREGMTEDELRNALIEGEKSGIVESGERAMVEGVFYLGDRPLGVFMTHRSEVQWLDIHAPVSDIKAKVLERGNQRCFPVIDGSLDAIVGAAYREDIILDLASDVRGLSAVMKKASFAPETMPALKAFEALRRGEAEYLFVMDEYGGFAGMVSAWNLMEKIVGELTAPAEDGNQTVRNEDGSMVASGGQNIDEIAELLSLPGLAGSGDYHTLAGLVLFLAGELPGAGDSFVYRGYRFTVLDMEGNRINRVGIAKD
ncbi:MAG: hemolysin family protein [Treponema sp.]|nr:hemolysin family protein [Treponema sp.]